MGVIAVYGHNNGCLGACWYDILRVGSQNRLQNGEKNVFFNILVGFISFMNEADPTLGLVEASTR